MINIDKVKQLRQTTGISISECKKALEEAKGDPEKAREILKKLGKDLAGNRMGKQASQGIVDSYVHANKKIGVMLELNCETDFAAKSKDFQELSHELCLQIAAMGEEEGCGEIPLLEQPWIKDATKTVKDLVNEYVAKVGENIVVKRFIRYEI